MIAALILAGGKGTRIGADKAFLTLNNRPFLAHLLDRLAAQVPFVAISANGDPARFAAYNLPVLPDSLPFTGKGPLAGIAAGLGWAAALGADALLTIPVDTPFIPTNLLSRLTPAPSVAVHGDRQHHLVALWPVGFLGPLEIFLNRPGAYKVRDALALCAARPVIFNTPSDPFLNINTPQDLAAARLCAPPPLC